MSQPIFTQSASQEERQVCELMASRKLSVDQCESTLLLTGIPTDSPYYSPPKSGKKGFFRSLYQAFQLSGRAEPVSSLPTPIVSNSSSSLSRVEVEDESHPLSETEDTSEPAPCVPQSCGNDDTAPAASEIDTPRSILASLVSYQLTLVLRVAKAFAWSSSPAPSEADDADEVKQELDDAATLVDQSSIRSPSRKVTLDLSSDYINVARREELFGSVISQDQDEREPVELLTPLQRAIQQAREHGYHLHMRAPLGPVTPTSPTSPVKTSPPGLQKYNLRSHQVGASDFYRKEASHRAAVAARNDNRQLLIGKKDWSPYEPPALIMPEEEIPRLRVVLSPRRFAVRLWKTEYRGPSDWIEIEEKGPRGGVAVFKRNSHLRHELDLSPPALHLEQVAPAPAYSESPTDEDVSFDMPMFVDQLMEKLTADKVSKALT